MRERPGALPKRNPAQKSSSAAVSEPQTRNFERKSRREPYVGAGLVAYKRRREADLAFRLVDMADRRPGSAAHRRPDRSGHHGAGDGAGRGLLLDRVSAGGKRHRGGSQNEKGGGADRETGHQAENSLKWLSLQRRQEPKVPALPASASSK